MSIRESKNRLSKSQFEEGLSKVATTLGELWAKVTELAIHAILHYHEHGYDSTFCRRLDEVLDEGGGGSLLTAYRRVLNISTGINRSNWKHSATKLSSQPEKWEDIIDRLEKYGLSHFKPDVGEKGKVVKQEKAEKSKAQDVAAGIEDESIKAAVMHFVKKVTETEKTDHDAAMQLALAATNPARVNPLDTIKSAPVRDLVEEYIEKVAKASALDEDYILRMVKGHADKAANALATCEKLVEAEAKRIKDAAKEDKAAA